MDERCWVALRVPKQMLIRFASKVNLHEVRIIQQTGSWADQMISAWVGVRCERMMIKLTHEKNPHQRRVSDGVT